MVRVDSERYESARREPTVSDFSITGRSMTGWALVRYPALKDDATPVEWSERCLSFVRTRPAK